MYTINNKLCYKILFFYCIIKKINLTHLIYAHLNAELIKSALMKYTRVLVDIE